MLNPPYIKDKKITISKDGASAQSIRLACRLILQVWVVKTSNFNMLVSNNSQKSISFLVLSIILLIGTSIMSIFSYVLQLALCYYDGCDYFGCCWKV